MNFVRVDIARWDSAVARQFAIQSIPTFAMYNPEGQEVKRGFNAVGHVLMPDRIPDGADEEAGGSAASSLLYIVAALGGFGLLLLIATKAMGPAKRPRVNI